MLATKGRPSSYIRPRPSPSVLQGNTPLGAFNPTVWPGRLSRLTRHTTNAEVREATPSADGPPRLQPRVPNHPHHWWRAR
eukprot:3913704-Prymnesium_polylepis.1